MSVSVSQAKLLGNRCKIAGNTNDISADLAHLLSVQAEFQAAGIPAESELAYGDALTETIKWVEQKGCDLVAMTTQSGIASTL